MMFDTVVGICDLAIRERDWILNALRLDRADFRYLKRDDKGTVLHEALGKITTSDLLRSRKTNVGELLKEMNPSGTLADGEEGEFYNLYVRASSEANRGGFRDELWPLLDRLRIVRGEMITTASMDDPRLPENLDWLADHGEAIQSLRTVMARLQPAIDVLTAEDTPAIKQTLIGPHGINDPTRPMTKSEAAKMMGFEGSQKSKTRQLSTGIKNGTIPAFEICRQSWVFSCGSFPKSVQDDIT